MGTDDSTGGGKECFLNIVLRCVFFFFFGIATSLSGSNLSESVKMSSVHI